jgi:hypothetical protein
MVQTIQARDISLYELEEKFGLQWVTNADFFTEWTMELLRSLTISDLEPFLADPSQLNTQPADFQLAVASYSQTPRPLLSDCDTDAEQLANLAQSRWDWIRLAVAQNPSTPEETLLVLAEDKVFKIRLAVAKNSVTSAEVLAVLAESDEEW